MNHLIIKNLKKTYAGGVQAISDISLEITNGMFGLLGANGAGKSTLMRTIAGLQKPDSGEIVFNNVNIKDQPLFIKKQLGYLPQDFGVYPKVSALQLLDHLAILKGVLNNSDRKEQINALLYKTNLYQYRKQAVSTYSGGMRQRFGIAQALLGNPQIIIVDEPTAGLDPEERNRFNNLLSEIGENVIMVLSTHLVEDVKSLCSQMAIVHQGKLVATGSPQHFIATLDGCVWTRKIKKEERALYETRFTILSTELQAGALMITVYAKENPGEGFAAKSPGLEDVYFNYLKKMN